MPGARSAKTERQARILSGLGQIPTLRVAQLAGDLHVSTETIRRDLDELYERGLLECTHGVESKLPQRHRIFA